MNAEVARYNERNAFLKFLAATEVVRIDEVQEIGVFAPLTSTGTIIVDEFACSCYAHVPHAVGHSLLSPFRRALEGSGKFQGQVASFGFTGCLAGAMLMSWFGCHVDIARVDDVEQIDGTAELDHACFDNAYEQNKWQWLAI